MGIWVLVHINSLDRQSQEVFMLPDSTYVSRLCSPGMASFKVSRHNIWFSYHNRLHTTPIILCLAHFPLYSRLRRTSHMLDVVALSNFDPAQRKYVWVYRWTRMEKRWQWLTGYEIRSLRHHRSPAALTVYRADVAACPSSLLLYCLLYSLPAALFSSAKPKPPLRPPSL